MPRTFPAKGTVAAGFGSDQRASWTVEIVTEAPVVVYAVSGFADGRAVSDPQPADEARAKGATSDPAQAGLGHEAAGVAERIQEALRRAVGPNSGGKDGGNDGGTTDAGDRATRPASSDHATENPR
jgi:hypothetical protein